MVENKVTKEIAVVFLITQYYCMRCPGLIEVDSLSALSPKATMQHTPVAYHHLGLHNFQQISSPGGETLMTISMSPLVCMHACIVFSLLLN